jgi:hypothetical protein
MFDITKLNPCSEGLSYFNSKTNFETAWKTCERGPWMLWIASKLGVDEHMIGATLRRCAKIVELNFADVNLDDERKIADICRETLTDEVLKKTR